MSRDERLGKKFGRPDYCRRTGRRNCGNGYYWGLIIFSCDTCFVPGSKFLHSYLNSWQYVSGGLLSLTEDDYRGNICISPPQYVCAASGCAIRRDNKRVPFPFF